MRDREKEVETQKEKQALCREPDVGLDPGTLGSCPEPKAGAPLLSPPGAHVLNNLNPLCPLIY